MRPRVFPAEDTERQAIAGDAIDSFNEAAGIPRGRLCLDVHARREWRRLQ